MAKDNQNYSDLNQEDYLRLQGSLLKEKGSPVQRRFLHATRDTSEFAAFIADNVQVLNGTPIPLFDGALTESSFAEPTQDQERRIYEIYRAVPPRTACRVSFWAAVTIAHIKSGKIREANWLASAGGVTETGAERIDRALHANGTDSARAIDDCVRTVLRRLSGLPAARGNRSVFVNPTFGRAWWRERLVARILERRDGVESRHALLEIVRRNQEYWERLVTMIVSRGSVFGSVDVQDALVNGLARHLKANPDTPLRSASTLVILLRRFSNLASSREMAVLDFGEINHIVDRLATQLNHTHK